MKYSFIIPCYKSKDTIEKVIDEIKDTMKVEGCLEYETILINDYPFDDTFEVIRHICENDCKVKGINLSKNFGQHSALMAGMNEARGEFIVCLDDDGQTPVKELNKFMQKLDQGYDVIFAKYTSKKHSLVRNFGSYINEVMARHLLNKPKNLALMSFFVCRKYVVDEIINYKNAYPYMAGLILRSCGKIDNVEIEHREREQGKSGYTFKKLIALWLNGFTAFSVKPLRIATVIGGVFSLIGFLYSIWIIVEKMINPEVVLGWSSVMAGILIIGGMILCVLGIIGEYIGRIYISLNNSPQYVIKEKINLEDGVSKV